MDPEISHSTADYEALVQFLYIAPVGLVQASHDGEIMLINPLSAQLLMPLACNGDLTNLFTALEGVAPDLRYQVANFAAPYGLVCEGVRVPVGPARRDGADAQVLSITLLKLDSERLMGVLNDVTQQVRRERLLKHNEAWLNAILTGIADYAIVSLDREGRIADWNNSIGRVTGFDREATVDRPYTMFCPGESTTPDRLRDLLREADDNGWTLDEGWRVKADGSRFWGSSMIAPLAERQSSDLMGARAALSEEPSGYCLVVRDLSDKRDASEEFRRANLCDQLTGLANRRTFFEAAELELARAKRSPRQLSLILLDADNFKRVNDTYGHPAGDAVLRHFATVCMATFREVDMVARMGGEEFAVLLPSTSLASAQSVAERLRIAIEAQPVRVGSQSIHITVSGGIATSADGLLAMDVLMKRADTALHAAKVAGRNRISCFTND